MAEFQPLLTPKVKKKEKRKRPPMYRVIMLNDDYTTMDFVVYILQKVFRKSYQEAEALMLEVHFRGSAVCGIYPKEIAETKVRQVHEEARAQGFPLLCTIEPEEEEEY